MTIILLKIIEFSLKKLIKSILIKNNYFYYLMYYYLLKT